MNRGEQQGHSSREGPEGVAGGRGEAAGDDRRQRYGILVPNRRLAEAPRWLRPVALVGGYLAQRYPCSRRSRGWEMRGDGGEASLLDWHHLCVIDSRGCHGERGKHAQSKR